MKNEVNLILGRMKKSLRSLRLSACSRKRLVNGSLMSINIIAPLLFIAFGLFGVNESAWAGKAYYTCVVAEDATTHSKKQKWGSNEVVYTWTFDNTVGIDSLELNYYGKGGIKVYYSVNKDGSNSAELATLSSYEGDGHTYAGVWLTGAAKNAQWIQFKTKDGTGTGLFDSKKTVLVENLKVFRQSSVSLSVNSFNFASTPKDGSTTSEVVTITTYNVNTITADSIDISGTNASYFSVSSISSPSGTCGATRTLSLTYSPTAVGDNHTATVTVHAGGKTATLTVSGTATNVVDPEYTWNGEDTYYVDDEDLDLSTLWTSTSGGDIEYGFTFTPASGEQTGSTAPKLAVDGHTLSIGKAGRLDLTLTQDETIGYYSGSDTKTINIVRRDPVFAWNTQANYYYNTTVNNFLTKSSGADYEVTSDNEQVANMDGANLKIYNKPGTVKIKYVHPETYYWSEKKDSVTFTPESKSNILSFTIDNDNKSTYVIEAESHSVWDDNGYKMGDNKWILSNAPHSYIVIAFTGIPDKLTFTKKCDRWGLNLPSDGDCLFEVYESATNGNWGYPIWSYNKKEESRDVTDVPQLKSTTRYIKLCYYGTVYGHFNNIKVTKREYFKATETNDSTNIVSTINFGDNYKNTTPDAQTFKFHHASAGYITTVTATNESHFTVTPTSVTTGGEVCDSVEFSVTYHPTDYNTHNGTITIEDNIGNSTSVTLTGRTIKRTPVVTAPTAKELTYTGSVQNLVNAGSTTGGTLQYALGAGEFSTSIPQATNAGDYTVYYKVIENDDYYGTDPVGVSASIAKANSVLNSAPTAEEDLVYSGSAQSLVSAGTATNGTLQYALGEGEFSTSIPQATDAGTYTVNYKVVGDANYNDVAASSLEVTIDKANSSISTAPTAKELTYTGSAQNLVNAGTATGGTLQYALGEGEFSTSIPQATSIGSYTVYYRVAANDNYNGIDAEDLAVTISPKASSIEEESSWEDVDEYTAVAVPESINVVIEDTVSVYSLDIDESSTFTIAPTGCLRVGEGGITGASAERLILQAVTDTKAATLGQTSAILFSPDYEGAMPTAKVEMYSVGYKDMTNSSVNRWQYVGVPINKADYAAKTAFPRSLVRSWDESEPDEADGWKNTRNTLKLQPFVGIATTYYFGSDGCKMTFEGQLAANRGTQVVNLTHDGNGWNLIANSFAGPIDVTKLTTDDFGSEDVTATLYIWDTQSQDYIELPVATIAELKDRQHVVPSMQAFFIHTNVATTLSLDYERLVWNGEESNVPLKAKRRENGESSVNAKMYISITDGVSTDNLCLLESQNYDAAYENGYDAPKKFSDADVNAIYSINDDYLLSVDATNSIAGTKLGLRTRESDFYLMTFTRVEGDGEWYLLDKNTEEKVRIQEGMEYEFTAAPNSTIEGRFEIVGTANTPAITTEVDNTDAAQKAEKYIKDNTLVILKGGTKYNSLGQKIQ